MVSVYLWQKANSIDDLPFLNHPSLISPLEARATIQAIEKSPEQLLIHYEQGNYGGIWPYIYRERLMIGGNKLPLVHYRSVRVDEYIFSDCFETSLRNAINYFCFQNAYFNPEVWKEGSLLRQYYSEFSITNPSDLLSRSVWGQYVARIPYVHYYTPSKKMNDEGNTHEAIPGILNMMRILCHLGDASVDTKNQLNVLLEKFELIDKSQLSDFFAMMITDITQGKADETSITFQNLNELCGRVGIFKDYGGELILQREGQLKAILKFKVRHAMCCFKNAQDSMVGRSDIACNILENLPLFEALKADYMDKSTLLRSAASSEAATSLLMKFDLNSSDIRREILPVLLERHAGLPLVKKILLRIEKEDDFDERRFFNKLFQEKLNVWIKDLSQEDMLTGLIQSVPTLFNSDIIRTFLAIDDERSPMFQLGIYMLGQAKRYSFKSLEDDIKYVRYLKNVEHLWCVPFLDSTGQIFDLKDFSFLEDLTLSCFEDNDCSIDMNTVLSQIPSWVKNLPKDINYMSFSDLSKCGKYSTYALAIQHALKDCGKESINFVIY